MSYSLADWPIYRGYPWVQTFCKVQDAAGNPIDLTTVTRVKCNLIKNRIVGIGSTPALVCDSTIAPYRVTFSNSVVIAGDGTYSGFAMSLSEADTLSLTPGDYWFALEMIRSGTADDLPPLLVQVPVIATGRTP